MLAFLVVIEYRFVHWTTGTPGCMPGVPCVSAFLSGELTDDPTVIESMIDLWENTRERVWEPMARNIAVQQRIGRNLPCKHIGRSYYHREFNTKLSKNLT